MLHSHRRAELILLPLALLAAAALLVQYLGVGDGRAGGVDVALGSTGDRPERGAKPDPAPRPEPAGYTLPQNGTPILTVEGGERVDIHTRPRGPVAATVGGSTEFGSPTVLSVADRRGNWVGVPTELLPNGELGWVELDRKRLDVDSVSRSIVVDLSSMSAKLLRDGEVERRWQVGIGAPDSPTPTGRFSVTDEIEGGLNPVYGCCAIALSATQPNLPEGWTGGNRIAIHGTSLPLGAANSTGCVHSAEDDLHALIDGAPLGTPVTIKD